MNSRLPGRDNHLSSAAYLFTLALYSDPKSFFRWNDEGKITEFKVMIRPLKAVNILHQEMAAKLQAASGRSAN